MNAKEHKTDPPAVSDMQIHAADAAGLMKALGNESRLMILCVLAEGPADRVINLLHDIYCGAAEDCPS